MSKVTAPMASAVIRMRRDNFFSSSKNCVNFKVSSFLGARKSAGSGFEFCKGTPYLGQLFPQKSQSEAEESEDQKENAC